MTWKPKVKIFEIIAKQIPYNITFRVPMKVCMSFMSDLKRYISGFDLDLIQIEHAFNIAVVT